MNRNLTYLCSLMVFFLMWGVFGFMAAAPRAEAGARESVPGLQDTPVVTEATLPTGEIPVTGESQPILIEIVVFYGLIGLTALFVILALLNVANKSTAPFVGRQDSSADKTDPK